MAEPEPAIVETGGTDTDGKVYGSLDDMWRSEIGNGDARTEWYKKGVSYWDTVPATVDGVLGGYGSVTRMDTMESEAFLKEAMPVVREKDPNAGLVSCDCGAGVGRVTKELLINWFNECDIVEPVNHFVDEAIQSLGNDGAVEDFVTKDGKRPALRADGHRAVRFIREGLEGFEPEEGRYDAVWCQWVLGHLPDDDLVRFFMRVARGLKPWGMFLIKENNCRPESGFIVDKEDHAITRSDSHFRAVFAKAGLKIVLTKQQRNFPQELFKVRMYALVPEERLREKEATGRGAGAKAGAKEAKAGAEAKAKAGVGAGEEGA